MSLKLSRVRVVLSGTVLSASVLAACSSSSSSSNDDGNHAGAGGGAASAGTTSSGGSSGRGGGAGMSSSSSGNGGNSAVSGTGGTALSSGGAMQNAGGAPSNGGGETQSAGAGGAVGNAGSSGSGGTTSSANGTIVPLYTDPSDASWTAIVTAKHAHPTVDVVAIVNPNSGPGDKVDSGYTQGIDALIAASITPIGYVSTKYAGRAEADVEADIDSWYSFYPHLAGIFFDEQSDQAGDVAFYAAVSTYAKGKGARLTVGNPGASVPAAYLAALDVMLIYESKGLPTLTSLSGDAGNRAHLGVIPYGAAFDASFVGSAKADVKYVYATSDDLPNPWDSLTPYFDQLLGALE